MNDQEFKSSVALLGYDLTDNQLNLFKSYFEFLVEYNTHTNITAITSKEEVYLKHFFDSILLIKSFDFQKIINMVDIGTGAGFPGLVIKILYPHINLILVDSNNKKTTFLEKLVNKLLLDKVEIICERSEIFAQRNLNKFDLVVARAVKKLIILSELCVPLVKIGGIFISMKSNIQEELLDSEYTINFLGGTVDRVDQFTLPFENSLRNNIIIKKTKATPKGYPRNYSTIIKKALKKPNK